MLFRRASYPFHSGEAEFILTYPSFLFQGKHVDFCRLSSTFVMMKMEEVLSNFVERASLPADGHGSPCYRLEN